MAIKLKRKEKKKKINPYINNIIRILINNEGRKKKNNKRKTKTNKKKIPIGSSTGLNSSGANNTISQNELLSKILKNTGNDGGGGNNKLLLEYIKNNENKILPFFLI